MNMLLPFFRSMAAITTLLAVAVTASAQSAAPAPTPAVNDENVVVLSPFQVSAETDEGYIATNTLAGSRMNTPLRDTAASISVLTSEFLADIAAVSLEDALEYANNVQPDAIDANPAGGTPNDNATFEFFTNFRVRGIPATVTRNYFGWRMPMDSFNTDRIEEARGPNSILFGIGSAGGIINSGTKRAVTGRDFVKGSVMVGSYGRHRGTIDLNQSAFDDKFAIRFNGVYDKGESYRQHAFDETRRGHVTAGYRAFPNTQVRLEYEQGQTKQVVARTLNLFDGFSSWQAAGSPTYPTTTANQNSYGGTNRATFYTNTGDVFNVRNTRYSQGSTASQTNVIADESVADPSINTGGPGQLRVGNFSALSAYLEQRLGQNTFLELAYNRQKNDSVANVLAIGSSDGATLRADTNELLPNGDPNPNVGRLMIEGQFGQFDLAEESENLRLSLSTEFDFGKFGNYRFAVLGEHEDRWSYKAQRRETWQTGAFNSNPENSSNRVYRRTYVTEGDWSSYYVAGPAVTGLITDMFEPVSGRTLSSRWTNQSAPVDRPEVQETILLGGQARYFDGRLVAGFGVRQDKLDFSTYPEIRSPIDNERTTDYANPTDYEYSGTTRTFGVVGHVTKNVSAFFNYSTNFSLPNAGIRVLPDSGPAPNPEGKGKDLGLAFDLFDGRLAMRATYFETDIVNGHDFRFGGSANNPTVFNNAILNALLNNGDITQQEYDARSTSSNGATFTRHVEGYELGVTANLSKSWRLHLNYSNTDGFETNIGPEVAAWYEDIQAYVSQFDTSLPTARNDGDTIAEILEEFEEAFLDIVGLDGLALPGNRQHKVSLFTRYTIREGALKGLFLGGGYRYQSKLVVGLSGEGEIQYGNSFGEADALFGYNFGDVGIFKEFRLQLNIRNLLDDEEPLVTRRRDDGTVYRWKIPAPRTYRLTANFEF